MNDYSVPAWVIVLAIVGFAILGIALHVAVFALKAWVAKIVLGL